MRKNTRIVSAAAAALLAVAPVASSVVSTAFAATAADAPATGTSTISVGGDAAATTDNTFAPTLKVTNVASLKDGSLPSTTAVSVDKGAAQGINITGRKGTDGKTDGKVYIFNSTDVTDGKLSANAEPVTKYVSGSTYVAVAEGVYFTGLKGNTEYKVGNETRVSTPSGDLAYGTLVSKPFSIPDAKKGTPYFTLAGKLDQVSGNASVDLAASNSVSSIVSAIEAKYDVKNVDDPTSAAASDYATVDWTHSDITDVVRAAVKTAGIKASTDTATFAAPAADIQGVKITATASNGKTASLNVLLKTTADAKTSYPVFTYNKVQYNDGASVTLTDTDPADATNKFNYVPVNGTVNVAQIQDAFTAQINSNNAGKVVTKVDTSKVNTQVAGKYPVTVSAINPAGLTSSISFDLTVGVKGAKYQTVQYEKGMSIPVYTINGNTVTKSTATVADGTSVATFGTVTVDGKKYVRINGKDSDQFIESQYVDGSYKPAATATKTVMHAAKIYDKTGKATGEKVASYTTVTIHGDKIKLDNGKEAYQVGDNQYVLVGNIDGTKRTLTHNSYVYKTSKKRANNTKLLKGAEVTTYGSSYTFKNGKAYYRIGKKQYVKVANF